MLYYDKCEVELYTPLFLLPAKGTTTEVLWVVLPVITHIELSASIKILKSDTRGLLLFKSELVKFQIDASILS